MLFGAACTDEASRSALTEPGPAAASVASGTYRPHEAEFVRISRSIPSFGGYFIDDAGSVVVYVTDLPDAADAEAAVAPIFETRPVNLESSVSKRPIVVRSADYTFTELAAWRDLVSEQLLDLRTSGLAWVDLDEGRNRVVLGVLTDADRAALELLVAGLGVPGEAVLYEEAGSAVPDRGAVLHALGSRFDTIVGGIIVRYDSAGAQECTLGPLAEYESGSGVWGFLTASHCSEVWFETDFGEKYQSSVTPGDVIGSETQDPSANCGSHCRWSDAAWNNYTASRPHGFGWIARTTSAGRNQGSLKIDHADPVFDVMSDLSNPVQGDTVHKVGIFTGWTYGTVKKTCTDSGFGKWKLECQDWADYGAGGGDSGAPVFLRETNTTVFVLGVHSHRDHATDLAVFSAVANIEFDLGTDLAFGPAPPR